MRFAREFGAAARVLKPQELGKLGLYNYPVRAPRSLGWLIRHTAHEIQHHRHDIIKILAVLEPPIVPAPKPEPEPPSEQDAAATEEVAPEEGAGQAQDAAEVPDQLASGRD